MPYSLEEYRTAFERAVGFIMGSDRIYTISSHLYHKALTAFADIANIRHIEARTPLDLDVMIESIYAVYEKLDEALQYDKNDFIDVIHKYYQFLLNDISAVFDEFNARHIAEVLGISVSAVEDTWHEGFANADAIALKYYHTIETVMDGLMKISLRLEKIRDSYEFDSEPLDDEHLQELEHIEDELHKLQYILIDAEDYANELEIAAREDAINTLLFFLEEIERRIASEA